MAGHSKAVRRAARARRREWCAAFRADAKHARYARIIGWMFLALGLAELFLQKQPSLVLLCGILLLMRAQWLKTKPVVAVYFDRVHIQTGRFMPHRRLRFSEVRELAIEGMLKAFLVLDDGSRIRLPLAQLDRNDRWRLLQTIQELRARPI
jgi:hypothetical protein